VLERLEDRTLPSVTIAPTNNGGNGYAGLDYSHSGGYVPPNSEGAAGPASYIEEVNQTVAIYSPKATGASQVSDSLSHFYGTVGGLPTVDSGAFYTDTAMIYDDNVPGATPTTGRFFVTDMNVDTNTGASVFDIAVSKSASPATLTAADWSFYQITTGEPGGLWADFPGNLGYNQDALVATFNMFDTAGNFHHAQVDAVSISDMVNGVPQSQLHHTQADVNDGSLRPAAEHNAAAGAPEWLVSEVGDGAHVNVYKMTNLLGGPTISAPTQLAVKLYSEIYPGFLPLQPDGTAITQDIDSRIQKAALSGNTLVAAHAVGVSGTEDDIQWYVIDVSSGTPVLQQQGDVSLGNNSYAYYPAIDINPSGQVGMTFMASGTSASTLANKFMSVYLTGRVAADPAGTMEPPLLVPAGAGQKNYHDFSGGRAGDLGSINVDPNDGTFWAANEFATAASSNNWGTAIANFTLSSPSATQVNLSGAFNRAGIVNDGTLFPSNGGLDSNGNAYSANLLGSSVTFGGNTYTLGSPGVNDVVSGSSTPIALPAGSYATLSFVGTGVNGNQANQTFTVTYADGSTQTFSQSLSDWHTPQGYPGEAQAAAMAYRDVYNGSKDSRAFYLYGYSLTLNAAKQLKSITLPQNGNVEVLAIDLLPATSATQVSLTASFTRMGIVTDGSTFSSTGGLDAHGNAYSANLLGSSVTLGGNAYALGAPGVADVVAAAGQTIALPAGSYATLSFVGTGVNGNQANQTFTVTYADGSTQTFSQSLSDWHTPQGYAGETQAAAMAYRDVYNGSKDSRAFYLYGYSLTLNAAKQLKSITLPSDGNVEVLAMDVIPAGQQHSTQLTAGAVVPSPPTGKAAVPVQAGVTTAKQAAVPGTVTSSDALHGGSHPSADRTLTAGLQLLLAFGQRHDQDEQLGQDPAGKNLAAGQPVVQTAPSPWELDADLLWYWPARRR
jgi:hypothetical protein